MQRCVADPQNEWVSDAPLPTALIRPSDPCRSRRARATLRFGNAGSVAHRSRPLVGASSFARPHGVDRARDGRRAVASFTLRGYGTGAAPKVTDHVRTSDDTRDVTRYE